MTVCLMQTGAPWKISPHGVSLIVRKVHGRSWSLTRKGPGPQFQRLHAVMVQNHALHEKFQSSSQKFSCDHLDDTEEAMMQKIIRSDGTKIEIFGLNSTRYVRRTKKDQHHPDGHALRVLFCKGNRTTKLF